MASARFTDLYWLLPTMEYLEKRMTPAQRMISQVNRFRMPDPDQKMLTSWVAAYTANPGVLQQMGR